MNRGGGLFKNPLPITVVILIPPEAHLNEYLFRPLGRNSAYFACTVGRMCTHWPRL